MPPRVSRRLFLAGAGAVITFAGCSQAVRRSAPASTTSTTGAPAPPSTSPPGRPATYIANGSRTGTAVALTFHGSGDLGLTNALLDQAKSLRAPITVFGVGTWLAANPSIARRILADGNELANHTFTHPDLGSLGASAVASEISRCADVLTQVQGNNGRWFRPSGLDRPTALILQQAGLAGYGVSVGYDVDPLDYQDPGATKVIARVQQGLQPGSIVSLHTGHAGTVQAFQPIVAAIRARSLRPLTVSQLLGSNPA
ncbi:MAG TPA: polysaccharide deacetylase family protein [Acidimicrobiales bacterium]